MATNIGGRDLGKGLLGLLACVSAGASAQVTPGDENFIRGSLSVRPTYVENANGVADSAAQIDEMQWRYGAALESLWRSELTGLELDYEITEFKFDKNSQPDDFFWEGESLASLGNSTTFYEVFARHSIRRVLNAPDAPPILLSSSQDREIFGISPLLRVRVNRANTLSTAYSYTEVDFGDSVTNDSTREGWDLIYTRFVSPIREISLVVGGRDIDYDTSDVADYKTTELSALMRVEHRTYDYALQLGVTRVEPKFGEEESEPTGSFSLNSRLSGNLFSLFANRSISDSSLGSGNDSFFSTEITFDSSIADLDQIVRTSAGLGWSYELLCDRCALQANIGVEDTDYLSSSANDARQEFYELALAYEFSARLNSRVSLRQSTTDATAPEATTADTDSDTARIACNYNLNRAFTLAFLFEWDRRGAGDGEDLVVRSAGLAATLAFE